MANYQLSSLARGDLREIAHYGLSQWGIAQARRYQQTLENCFRAIGEGEITGRAFIKRRADLLFTRCEHHFIFFVRRADKCPLILAVFHERMDLMTRLRARLEG